VAATPVRRCAAEGGPGVTGNSRREHLTEVAEVFWPEPWAWELGRGGDHRNASGRLAHEFIVVPNAAAPRLLLPGPSRLAAAASRAHGGRRGMAGLRSRALSASLQLAAGRLLFRDRLRVIAPEAGPDGTSILRHLADVFSTPVTLSMPVTRARANRKPVLHILDTSGRTLGFVKVGINDLTRALVRREAAALTRVAGQRLLTMTAPTVLAHHQWNGLELLVLAPLELGAAHGVLPPARVAAAARELAEVAGVTKVPLADSPYWRTLQHRCRHGEDARLAVLRQAAEVLTPSAGDRVLSFGAWHGDWAPWNMCWDGHKIVAWDFERYTASVPQGLDGVHFDLQTRILLPDVDPVDRIRDRFLRAHHTLAPAGVPADAAQTVFAIYLIEIAHRWIADGQDAAGDWGRVLDGVVQAALEAAERVAASSPLGRGKASV
jgi:Phosphotransferase enzyme family